MASPCVASLRSVSLDVPDLARAESFYVDTWHLAVAARAPGVLYLRGSGADHHLLALHQADRLAIRDLTLRARHPDALADIARAAATHGGEVISPVAPLAEPGGGWAVTVSDLHGRRYRIVHGDERHADAHEARDRPVRLAHAVLNSHDVETARRFLEAVMGFRLADRTRVMAFMNCDRDHHTIALADADNDALNHIAFLMPDLDSVMRGGARLRDAQHAVQWGPGRHGPGNNAFNYFIGPFGEVIEYTAEVEQIDEHYAAGGPDDWNWPPGRIDQWGIAQGPTPELKQAQRSVFFIRN